MSAVQALADPDPWESLDEDLQEVLTRRVNEMWPDRTPADFWRIMGPRHRAHWIWNERHGRPITRTWHQDEERITANADPATAAALDALPIVSRVGETSANTEAGVTSVVPQPRGIQPIDWHKFWANETSAEADFIIEPVLAAGRGTAIYSSAKTGKSLLMLDMVAAAVTGRSALGQPARPPIRVVYLDLEMTEADLRERLSDLGYGPDDDLSGLAYFQATELPSLDRELGGIELADIAQEHRADLVVVDTMARVVVGPENDADTYRAFYRHTGSRLKALGIALARLDHEGKDSSRGQRGNSAKGDDVDVVYRLTADGNNLRLKRTHTRVPWIPPELAILRREEPYLGHVVATQESWPAGTAEVAALLDELEVPLDATVRMATTSLKTAKEGRRVAVVTAALKYRKTRP